MCIIKNNQSNQTNLSLISSQITLKRLNTPQRESAIANQIPGDLFPLSISRANMFQVTYVALQINHLNACFRTTHLGPGRVPPPFWQRPGLNHLCDMFFKLQQRNKIKMSVPPAYPFIEESILAECQQCDNNNKKYPEKQISMAINKLSNLFITAGS